MTNEEALRCVKKGRYAEADEMIIEALEKQIPMKPNGCYPFYCPRCNTKLDPTRYCGSCGQQILWEEEKGED